MAVLRQTGATWSAHCGAEVVATDPLGLCYRHRLGLLDTSPEDGAAVPGGVPRVPEDVLNRG